ncbi:MAG: 3-hydroxyacyl-CoA dehydrogenase / enoyl-CoA hydratase / 3-hydroxybutyryl-CoA epimerase [Ramlibacter sp.]|nr:3-hydroxyacyl-CoA dehydrogenase / enoyl-CoA hydratase / 3-hydroxybutyryl-CoA epimerase [Ramlibacter sp.]
MDLIRTELGADGVLLATIDMPGRSMNVFSAELMDALEALMERVDADAAVRSVVLTSGKPTFLAGADLVMVQGYCDAARDGTHAQMFEMCGRLGRLFVRLEQSAKPWVAAVNGLALGGGLELALACRARLVADDPKLQLGVPEVRWGLLPGAGGTQRLPRLAGFEPALRMLLSGLPIAPAEALRLRIVDAVVPPGELMMRAREEAVALQGRPYDAAAKFPQLAQSDAPPHSAPRAAAIAAGFGVSSEDFALYPAYSAIVDSVLLGARLPLDQATAVEMNQFLRLMFSPVAGRMIRTLFLERLRAERELAPPAGVKVESLRVGSISPQRASWAKALERCKVQQVQDATLAADTLEILAADGTRHAFALRVSDEAAAATPASALVLAPAGPYGRVLEIIATDDAAAHSAAALATRLWSLPWRTPGPSSVLQRLHGRELPEQARIAAECAAAAGAGDPVFLDVAACLAGLSPAWSGGPLLWASAQ